VRSRGSPGLGEGAPEGPRVEARDRHQESGRGRRRRRLYG
jgi:hypothetical protein